MKYYVYTYSTPDGALIYIGKGLRDRDISHWEKAKRGRNTHNTRFANKLKELHDNRQAPVIERVFEGTAKEALIKEAELIQRYGRLHHDENGILLNHSAGFEYFNIPEGMSREDYLDQIDILPHFNQKQYPEVVRLRAIELYRDGHTQKKVQDTIRQEFMEVRIPVLREWWKEAGLHIRTKSEMRQGELNPAFGRRGLVTKGFSGRKHSEESKKKISNSLRSRNK